MQYSFRKTQYLVSNCQILLILWKIFYYKIDKKIIQLLYETYLLYKHMSVFCVYLAHANDIFVYIYCIEYIKYYIIQGVLK
jgi:hypothetical protein